MNAAQLPSKNRRRWFQYSLVTLLVAMLVSAVLSKWGVDTATQVKLEQQAVEAIRERGADLATKQQIQKDPFAEGSQASEPVVEMLDASEALHALLGTSDVANLASVILRDRPISDEDLELLRPLKQVRHLDLSGTKITNAGLAHLTEFDNLQTLDLDGTLIADAGLAHLRGLQALKKLNLRGTLISDAGMEHLRELNTLTEINLDSTDIGDAGLEQLGQLKELTSLGLYKTKVTDAGLGHLTNLRLNRLAIESTGVRGPGLEHLRTQTQLTTLNIVGNDIDSENFAHLEPLPNLYWLWVSGENVDDETLEHLRRIPKLRMVRFWEPELTPEELARVSEALPEINVYSP